MKRLSPFVRFAFITLLLLGGTGCPTVPQLRDIQEESQSGQFVAPVPDRWVLENGLTVLFLEDHELPFVQGALYTPGGSYWAGEREVGLPAVMGDQMRQGGAGELSADALDEELEKLAASIGTSVGSEYGKSAFASLSSDRERVIQIFADVVQRPRFEESRLKLWKGQALEGIRRRIDDPAEVAGISFSQLIYGETPYGRVPVDSDVTSVTRDSLIAMHQKLIRPDGAYLVLGGDLSKEEALRLSKQYFSKWATRGAPLPSPPPINAEPKPGIYYIKLPFQQSTVRMGELGPPRFTPDQIAIDGFNEILSGNFASRLFARIRTELGLAYSVYGGTSPGLVRGVNSISLQTKSASTADAIAESLRSIEALQSSPAQSEELSDVKRSIENSYIFKFASSERLLERSVLLELLGYPKDYDSEYLNRVRALDLAAIQGVASNRWALDRFVIVVVGDENAYNTLKAKKDELHPVLKELPLIECTFNQRLKLP